jgi:hypothetical protein
MMRYNSTTNVVEYFNGLAWTPFKPSGGPPGSGYFVLSKGAWNGCGEPAAISSITFSGTTATLTTSAPHGLSTGASVTVYGATPVAYQGTFTITVTSTTKFTYTMGSNPGANATVSDGSHGEFAGYCSQAGGLSVQNANCLTELTTNTSWFGYAEANAAGLLNSTHVKAFLCDNSTCNNLTANATYYFASNIDTTSGGGSFVAGASGLGPNDSGNWASGSRFGGVASAGINGVEIFWTGRGAGSATAWPNSPDTNVPASKTGTCNGWTTAYGYDGTSGSAATSGLVNTTTSSRWKGFSNSTQGDCGSAFNLICLVNP